jgi:hypothetical protein
MTHVAGPADTAPLPVTVVLPADNRAGDPDLARHPAATAIANGRRERDFAGALGMRRAD